MFGKGSPKDDLRILQSLVIGGAGNRPATRRRHHRATKLRRIRTVMQKASRKRNRYG